MIASIPRRFLPRCSSSPSEFIRADGTGYPIHLLDTWKRNSIHKELAELIRESCDSRRTIIIPLRKDDSLESAIFNRRS